MAVIHNLWEADNKVAHCVTCGQWVWTPTAKEGKCKLCKGDNNAAA
jgi:recombinational DNA repair protein RecR